MRTQRVACSTLLVLVLPVTLGLACLKRDWSVCTPKDHCKSGYTCTPDWHCVQIGDGGNDGLFDSHGTSDATAGGLDGPAPAGTDGPGGAAPGPDAVDSAGAALPDAAPSTPGVDAAGGAGGNSSGPDAAPDVMLAPPDAPSLLAVGAPCSVGNACTSGICADAVCCDKTCSGCNACDQALTGQPSGTCAPVTSGKNAHNFCKDETATKKCGNDGTCDGAGACRNASTSVVCADASCNGSVFTPVSTCDGKGACVAVKTQDCAPFLCSQTGCSKTCATAADCDSTTSFCDTATKTCAAKLSNGKPASSGPQCTSGVVADGVCCDKACTGCSACTRALNGQTDGQCLPVPAGKATHNACAASNVPCGLTGVCDGAGSCQSGARGTPCGSTCTGSTLTPKTCDGAGACVSGTSSSCAPYVCAATGDVCGGKKAAGGGCSSDSDCDSAKCEDNLAGTAKICCAANCSTCQGCNSSGTGCTRKNTSAPDSACGTTAASCQNGTCDNNGACAATPGVLCGAGPSCSAGVVTAAYACNSSGQCAPGGQTNCASGACNSAATGCSTGKALGASCSQGTECSSGFCAGSVCCNRACTGACEQCSAATLGQCTYKTGTVCNAAADCMDAAVCSGSSGACPDRQPKSAGTFCGSVTCSGSTQSASTCNGQGTCGARTYTECAPFACVSGSGCKKSCASNSDCVQDTSIFCGKTGACQEDSACWHDLATNLLWQVDADPSDYRLDGATALCGNLTLCGFDDWGLPTVDDLRSLVRRCPDGQTGGACGVTNSCLADSCDTAACMGCPDSLGEPPYGCYQVPDLAGLCGGYWTSSTYPSHYYDPVAFTTRVRVVGFTGGGVGACDPTDSSYVRCVRRWP